MKFVKVSRGIEKPYKYASVKKITYSSDFYC